MKMRFLGKSGIKVSEVCLGTMTFGANSRMKQLGSVGQPEADKIVAMALDGGINFFDTADLYSEGQSEEILGKALGKRRKDIILATKVRNRMGPGPNDIGLSRHHILEGCEASLKRLGTDYIDLYLVHRWDPAVRWKKRCGCWTTSSARVNSVRVNNNRYTLRIPLRRKSRTETSS